MDYATFKNLVREHPLISAPQLAPLAGNRRSFNNQISNWKQRGLLVALKKGVYLLNENDRKVTPSREFVANQLAFPSYVSLEYALSFSRGLDEQRADRFVGMYVNELTLDYGDDGRRGIEKLLHEAHRHGLIPAEPPISFV